MRKKEVGFTVIELLVAVSIMALAGVAAGMAMFQVFGGTDDNNDRLTALHQVQNAGYWISRDTQMAISVNTTSDLVFPEFLHMGWTEWDDAGIPNYHLISYTLVNGSDNLYSLKRMHTDSGNVTTETMIADYIFYQPGTANSSDTSYSNGIVQVNITAIRDDVRESREYKIIRRAGLTAD